MIIIIGRHFKVMTHLDIVHFVWAYPSKRREPIYYSYNDA